MPRKFYDPNPAYLNQIETIVPVLLGGTGASTITQAAANLNAFRHAQINQPSGPIGLNSQSKIDNQFVTSTNLSGTNITGPNTLYSFEKGTYTLTDFSDFITYELSTFNGTVNRTGSTIEYTPTSMEQGGFVINGRFISVEVFESLFWAPRL